MKIAAMNVGVQEQPRRPGATLTDVVPVQAEWADGYLLPSEHPDPGVEFDREAAWKYPMRMYNRPSLRRLDGSCIDW
ncbi:MAG: hypothetical protein M3Q65_02305 [Chloroflexota bacterium]|nr:hypothetical protein [Chloroflexota bacterium]